MLSVFAFVLTVLVLIVNLIYSGLAVSGAIPIGMIGVAKLIGYAILLGGLGINLVALVVGVIGVAKFPKKRGIGLFGILISTPQILVEAAMLLPLITGRCWIFFCI